MILLSALNREFHWEHFGICIFSALSKLSKLLVSADVSFLCSYYLVVYGVLQNAMEGAITPVSKPV